MLKNPSQLQGVFSSLNSALHGKKIKENYTTLSQYILKCVALARTILEVTTFCSPHPNLLQVENNISNTQTSQMESCTTDDPTLRTRSKSHLLLFKPLSWKSKSKSNDAWHNLYRYGRYCPCSHEEGLPPIMLVDKRIWKNIYRWSACLFVCFCKHWNPTLHADHLKNWGEK